jgi:hypothetical protein
MADVTLKCPSCGEDVGLGDIVCASCGINLKSGEAYETRVKQAKGKAVHPEHFASPVYVVGLVAAAVFLFAGLKWQQTCEEAMTQQPEWFSYAVLQMRNVDDLVAQGNLALQGGDSEAARKAFEEARGTAEGLVGWLQQMADSIKPDESEILTGKPKTPRGYATRKETPYDKNVVKRLLVNLQKKAQRKLEQLPAVPGSPAAPA